MALETSINVCIRDACTTIAFKETTGAYNVISNLTGYGAPNPTTASATAAVLRIIDPNDVEYTIDLLDTGSWPTTNEDLEYEIALADIGSPETVTDGYWQFIYTVTSGAVDYVATKTAIFTCNSSCCVNSLLLDIDTNNLDRPSPSNQKKINNYLKAKAALDSIKHYAYCGNLEKFDNIKLILDKLCANSGCDSCN